MANIGVCLGREWKWKLQGRHRLGQRRLDLVMLLLCSLYCCDGIIKDSTLEKISMPYRQSAIESLVEQNFKNSFLPFQKP